ncbi:MAG TPA: serine hydrolase domain-containing protein [Candidatus Obscuribacterales bacterium]
MSFKGKTAVELFALALALATSLAQTFYASEPHDFPVSGEPVPKHLRWLDEHAKSLVRHWAIPGGAIAVYKDGQLVFARGYGYADIDKHQPVNPTTSLFRIASLSKPITAAAVMKLEEQGRLNMDDKALNLLDATSLPTVKKDKRLSGITVKDLLNMTAGWDRERSGDPILQPYIRRAARHFHTGSAADFDTTLRYVFSKRLDFTPGTRFAYSNFTYGLLGKIIERQSGKDYVSFVRENIFNPCGVQLYPGRTLAQDRWPDEVAYYAPLEPQARPFLPCRERLVGAPYSRAYMEADVPMLGWLASAPNLAKLFDKLFADEQVLSPESKAQIVECPDVACWRGKRRFFSMGWEVIKDRQGRIILYKDGTLPGTRAFVEHTADGITWVALFNARPPEQKPDKFAKQLQDLMSTGLDSLPSKQTAGVLGCPPAH